MKKDWKYIAYLVIAVGIYLAIKLVSPREFDWRITYHHDDKNPFGAYALAQLIDPLFPAVSNTNYTLYELYDSLETPANFLSISSSFNPGEEDTEALLANISMGGSAFISAQHYYGIFADTLFISTYDILFNPKYNFNLGDTIELQFSNSSIPEQPRYAYPYKNIHNYFDSFPDSITSIVTVNEHGLPVTIRIQWGKGSLYLNSTPLAFTNFYLLSGENDGFVETSLSHLPNLPLEQTEFYHLGRMEARTPLRFILTSEPLRWAYYLTILSSSCLWFLKKRKQRIIPLLNRWTILRLNSFQQSLTYICKRKTSRILPRKKLSISLILLKHSTCWIYFIQQKF